MRQLVDHQVAHYLGALEHQAAIQTDRTARRAATPATALAADQDALEIKTQLPRQRMQGGTESLGRSLGQPATQQLAHSTAITRIPFESQQPLANLLEPQTLTNSGEVDAPHFA